MFTMMPKHSFISIKTMFVLCFFHFSKPLPPWWSRFHHGVNLQASNLTPKQKYRFIRSKRGLFCGISTFEVFVTMVIEASPWWSRLHHGFGSCTTVTKRIIDIIVFCWYQGSQWYDRIGCAVNTSYFINQNTYDMIEDIVLWIMMLFT